MSERSDQILKTSGLPDPSLAVLERGDALFVLTASTLLYHDESGTRRVTLRDLARIHSDQEGTLRVETPAGTALSASLVGFDPAEVQAFFRQVRDVTAQAKQLPASPVPGGAAPSAGAAPAPSLAKPADPAPAPVAASQPPATQAAPAARPVVQLPEQPQTVAGPAFPAAAARGGPSAAGAGTSGTTATTDETTKPAGTPPPPPPRRQASASPAAQPAAGAQTQKPGGQKPPAPRPAAPQPQPSAAPAAKAQPRVVASPSSPLPVPSGPAPVAAAPTPASPVPAAPAMAAPVPTSEAPVSLASPVAGARAELLAQAGTVAGLGGRLRLLAVILMLAALGLAYFLFTAETPQPLNALWVIVAGGVGAVALTVLASLTRLLATMAQVVGARENGDG